MPSPRAGIALAILSLPSLTFAQGEIRQRQTSPAPRFAVVSVPDPTDPRMEEYRAQQRRRVALERDLYKLRADHFGQMRNPTIRQAGIDKLRTYTDPAIFPSLLKIFAREKEDVRLAVLNHLASIKTDAADATIAWAAVFDKDRAFRDAASRTVVARAAETSGPPERVKSVVAEGLARSDDATLAAAAHLADALNLVQAIPMLINAQLGGGGSVGTGGGGGDGALALIVVGTQTAFVSDLQPVVGDGAVAFDPTLAVITEGSVLRVINATVVTYRYEVHGPLVALSSRAWGRSTEKLGFDQRAWAMWYENEFLPARAAEPPRAAR
ncbi:MAG: hypothetical protein ACKVW3_07390 [Phycisphaerales bacterium]